MKRLNYLIILSILLSSCTYKLVPTWYDDDTHKTALAEITDQGITVRVENIEFKEYQTVFDIEIINNTDQQLSVKTDSFYHLTSQSEFTSTDSLSIGQIDNRISDDLRKFSPRTKAQITKTLEDKIKTKSDANGCLLFLGAAILITDVALDVKDIADGDYTEEEEWDSYDRDVAVASSLAVIDQIGYNNENRKLSLEDELYYLRKEILDIQGLAPKAFKRGKVYFQNTFRKKCSRLVLPIGDTHFVFDFRKYVY